MVDWRNAFVTLFLALVGVVCLTLSVWGIWVLDYYIAIFAALSLFGGGYFCALAVGATSDNQYEDDDRDTPTRRKSIIPRRKPKNKTELKELFQLE